MKKIQGFTLLELLMAIIIVAILTSFALPAFQNTIANTKINSDKDILKGALNLARLEAISRPTKMSFESNGKGGWQVRDVNKDEVIRTFYISGVDPSIATVASPIVYNPTGYREFGGSAVEFKICHKDATKGGKKVVVSTGGSVKSEIVTC